MKLIFSKRFNRAYVKFVYGNSWLQNKVDKTLELMEEDIFNPILNTHKLSGNMYKINSCSCGYDCRIIFQFEINKETNEEEIVLLNVGTHDDVY